jgi:hypothetical protein
LIVWRKKTGVALETAVDRLRHQMDQTVIRIKAEVLQGPQPGFEVRIGRRCIGIPAKLLDLPAYRLDVLGSDADVFRTGRSRPILTAR